MQLKMVLKFGAHYPQIPCIVCIVPGAFKIEDIWDIFMEHIIGGCCVPVYHTALPLVKEVTVPPFSKQLIEIAPCGAIKLKMVQHTMKISKVPRLVIIVMSCMFMEPALHVSNRSKSVIKVFLM